MKELKFILANEILERYAKGERDFSNFLLNGINLASADLKSAVFKNCWIKGVRFARVNLTDVDFEGATIEYTGFVDANLTRTNFRNTKIRFCYGVGAILNKTNFENADMFWVGFPNCNRGGANLTGAKTSKVYWSFDEIDFASAFEIFLPELDKIDLPESTKMRIKANTHSIIQQLRSESKSSYHETKKSFGKFLSEIYSSGGSGIVDQYGEGGSGYSEKMDYGEPSPDNKKRNLYKGRKK